jgi:hypothetical protein
MTEFQFDGHGCGLFAMSKDIKVMKGSIFRLERNPSNPHGNFRIKL